MIHKLLSATRQRKTGKSHLLAKGIENYDKPFMLVCRNIHEGKRLTNGNPNAKYVTPSNIDSVIEGNSLPIIFDQEEVLGYLKRILELESEVNFLKDKESIKNNKIREIIK